MPQRLLRPAAATWRGLIRGTGAIVIAALIALAFIQTGRINNNVDAIRDIVRHGRTAQVEGCHRGNLLRAQVNRNVEVLGAFIGEAVKARRASGDNAIADRYEALLPKLTPLVLVNCELAFPAVPK